MEVTLAIVVVVAVLLFGALISTGNERHRRAIDGLREQAELWAIQDLRLKRAQLARTVQIDDPLEWLNRVASRESGYDLRLRAIENFDEPSVLVCESGLDAGSKILFTPVSPNTIQTLRKQRRNRLFQSVRRNPLLDLPRKIRPEELSVLRSDPFFDVELSQAWHALTGQEGQQLERLWMYIVR